MVRTKCSYHREFLLDIAVWSGLTLLNISILELDTHPANTAMNALKKQLPYGSVLLISAVKAGTEPHDQDGQINTCPELP